MGSRHEKPRRALEQAPNASPTPAGARKDAPAAEKPTGKKVLHWLNSAKGIGVILVILGHLLYKSSWTTLNQFIYAFHMPMFFLVSGYVQKPTLKRLFLPNKVLRLLVPFLIYTLFSIPILSPLMLGEEAGPREVLEDAFYLHGQVSNNPLWFLMVLFEVYCLFFLLHWALGHPAGQLLLCAGAFGAGGWLYLHKDVEALHTLGFNRAVICFGFFLAGMLLQHLHMEQIRFWHWLLLPVTLLPGLYVGMVLNKKISFYMFKLRIYHWFLLSALLLTVAVLLFARLFLDRPGYLAYLSRYSIVFLGTQFLWMRPLQFHLKDLELLDTTYAYQVLFAAAAVYILFTPLVYDLLKKYLPFLKLLNGEAL